MTDRLTALADLVRLSEAKRNGAIVQFTDASGAVVERLLAPGAPGVVLTLPDNGRRAKGAR